MGIYPGAAATITNLRYERETGGALYQNEDRVWAAFIPPHPKSKGCTTGSPSAWLGYRSNLSAHNGLGMMAHHQQRGWCKSAVPVRVSVLLDFLLGLVSRAIFMPLFTILPSFMYTSVGAEKKPTPSAIPSQVPIDLTLGRLQILVQGIFAGLNQTTFQKRPQENVPLCKTTGGLCRLCSF